MLLQKKSKKVKKRRLAIVNVLRKYIKESKDVRFEGDGYSEDWVNEAAKRKLGNVKNMVRALDAYLTKKSLDLFEKHGVMCHKENEARVEIKLEVIH